MNEVARDTFDYERFVVVTQLMWESMENQRPAAWRVVFKGLTLLEHLVKNGSERCVDDARNHGHILRALGQFNYYEGTIDRGLGVREKSKQILDILSDDDRIREERQRARKLREKFGGKSMTASSSGGGGSGGGGGYGNQDSWNNDRRSGGYGEGGIDSSSSNQGYSGRYGNEARGSSSGPTPTFAAMPSDGKKKKKKKKPKSPTAAAPAPAPEPGMYIIQSKPMYFSLENESYSEINALTYDLRLAFLILSMLAVDLFSFDDPSPAPAPAASANNDDFANFQTSTTQAATNDDFANFQTSTTRAAAAGNTNNDSFGAFQTTPAAPNNNNFDAFGNMQSSAPAPQQQQSQMQQQSFDAFGNNNMMNQNNNMSQMNNAFGAMNMANNQTAQPPAPAPADDDDFGDFADAAPKSVAAPAGILDRPRRTRFDRRTTGAP